MHPASLLSVIFVPDLCWHINLYSSPSHFWHDSLCYCAPPDYVAACLFKMRTQNCLWNVSWCTKTVRLMVKLGMRCIYITSIHKLANLTDVRQDHTASLPFRISKEPIQLCHVEFLCSNKWSTNKQVDSACEVQQTWRVIYISDDIIAVVSWVSNIS